jgi:hypothetical protein
MCLSGVRTAEQSLILLFRLPNSELMGRRILLEEGTPAVHTDDTDEVNKTRASPPVLDDRD